MSAIGLRVGPFEICDEVAIPASGSWYRASRTGLTRRRPLDVLVRLLGPAPSSRDLADVQHQFDTLRSLDDRRFPTAVALYEGTGALALDAPVGLNLSRIVEGRVLGDLTMTPATLLDLALELVEAMGHAHQRGYHHGHLSAQNVVMGPDGSIWIWGLGERGIRPPFAWIAPERARGEAATAATDQWSLGALIVALVTGRTPWSPTSVDVDPRSGDIESFVAPVARQWPALGRLARRMLDPNPALRFPSLHPVRLELLALARRAGGTSDRRPLGAWLHRTFGNGNDVDRIDEVEVTGNAPIAPTPVMVEVEDEEVVVDAGPAPVTTARIEDSPRLDEGPRIDDAPRVAVDPGRKASRPEPLPSESMAIVRPAGFEDDDVEEEPPPVRARAASEEETPTDPDFAETDMIEDFVMTEMVPEPPTVQVRLREPAAPEPAATPEPVIVTLAEDEPATLPPVDGPAQLKITAAPHYRTEPVPTLPGMDAPDIGAIAATPLPAPVVMFELEDDELDEDAAGLLTEDELLVDGDDLLDDDLVDDGPGLDFPQADDPASFELLDDAAIESLDEEVGPGITVMPFTNPDFAGPSLSLRSAPAPSDPGLTGPTWTPTIDVDALPAPVEPPLDLPDPNAYTIVRVAPWLGSAAVVGLALLTVVNAIF